MTKYKEYFNRMVENNKDLFEEFDELYQKYTNDQDSLQEEFNKLGERVMAVIKEWENKLCSTSERAGFGNYTSNLSEKFWGEIRSNYPLIDYIGVVVKKNQKITDTVRPAFEIKKINF